MIARAANGVLAVESEVPCDTLIYWWLRGRHVGLDQLVQDSRRYEHPYLAWEMVRKARNPFFELGTGFEGYFVGICQSPDETLARLLDIGQNMLASITRLYRFDHILRSKLMKTLTGELSDPKMIDVWSAQLGATLGRLRCNVSTNPQAKRFHRETYGLVDHLPTISYQEHDQSIEQEYIIQFHGTAGAHRESVGAALLKPGDQDAGLVVWSIGRFGHPLVREYLREACVPRIA